MSFWESVLTILAAGVIGGLIGLALSLSYFWLLDRNRSRR